MYAQTREIDGILSRTSERGCQISGESRADMCFSSVTRRGAKAGYAKSRRKLAGVRLSGIHVALKENRIIFAPPLERGRRRGGGRGEEHKGPRRTTAVMKRSGATRRDAICPNYAALITQRITVPFLYFLPRRREP